MAIQGPGVLPWGVSSGGSALRFGNGDSAKKPSATAKAEEKKTVKPLGRREAIWAMLLTALGTGGALLGAERALESEPVREALGLPSDAERLGLPEIESKLAGLLGLEGRVKSLEGASVVGDVAVLQAQMDALTQRVSGVETQNSSMNGRITQLETNDTQNVKVGFLEERLNGFKQLIFEELDLDGKLENFKKFLLEDLDLDGRFNRFKTYLLEDLDIDGRLQTLRTEFTQSLTNLQNGFNHFIEQQFPWVENLTTTIRDGYNNLIRNINTRLGLNLPVIESPPKP